MAGEIATDFPSLSSFSFSLSLFLPFLLSLIGLQGGGGVKLPDKLNIFSQYLKGFSPVCVLSCFVWRPRRGED